MTPQPGERDQAPPQEATMLILTLKPEETVFIGDNIRLMVVGIRGKEVSLGIEAPPDILVLRGKIKKKDSRR